MHFVTGYIFNYIYVANVWFTNESNGIFFCIKVVDEFIVTVVALIDITLYYPQ